MMTMCDICDAIMYAHDDDERRHAIERRDETTQHINDACELLRVFATNEQRAKIDALRDELIAHFVDDDATTT